MGILLDTCFLYALKDRHDPKYEQAQKILKNLPSSNVNRLITASTVVNETYTLMMYRSKSKNKAFTPLNNMFWGKTNFFEIIFFNKNDFQEIANTMEKYSSPKKLLSFVDASLIYLGTELNIQQIVSFDAHFDGILTRIIN